MSTPFGTETRIFDPSTNFSNAPAIVDYKTKQEIVDHQAETKKLLAEQCKKQGTKKWYHVFAIQAVIALISTAFVDVLLYVFNPPMTQVKRSDEFTSEKQDWKKVLVVSLLVFFLIFLLPEFIRLVSVLVKKK